MELKVTGVDVQAEGDAGQNLVGFEADRIALRRLFEVDHETLINEQTAR